MARVSTHICTHIYNLYMCVYMHIHIHIYISFKATLAYLGYVYIQNYRLSKETSQTQRGRSSRRASSINSRILLLFPESLCFRERPRRRASSLSSASLWLLAPLPFPPGAGPRALRTLPGVGWGLARLARLAHQSHPG